MDCQTTKIFDDNIIDDDEPVDIHGPFEIHFAANEDDNVKMDNALPSTNTDTSDILPPPATRRVTVTVPK